MRAGTITAMSRTILPEGFKLKLDRLYTIEALLGQGAGHLVYRAAYTDSSGFNRKMIIRELYPSGLQIQREGNGALQIHEAVQQQFHEWKERMLLQQKLLSVLQPNLLGAFAPVCLEAVPAGNTLYTLQPVQKGCLLHENPPCTPQNVLVLMRSLACGMQALHDTGWLCLDVKPDNLYWIEEAQSACLIDLDGIIKNPEMNLRQENRLWSPEQVLSSKEIDLLGRILPFTPGFSAPELEYQPPGIQSDVFAWGALLFWMICKRAPDAADCAYQADLDLSLTDWDWNSYDDRLESGIRQLLWKTLSSWPKGRMSGMEQILDVLDTLLPLASPSCPFVSFHVPQIPAVLCRNPGKILAGSRKREADDFLDLLEKERIIQVNGMAGAGKSTLVQAVLQQHMQVLYLYWNLNLICTLGDDSQFSIHNLHRDVHESLDEYVSRKLILLRREYPETLIVLDDLPDDFHADLTILQGFQLVLIARKSVKGIPAVHMKPIQNSAYWKAFFSSFADRAPDEEFLKNIEKLVIFTGGHPLSLYICACCCASDPKKLSSLVQNMYQTSLDAMKNVESLYTGSSIAYGTLASVMDHLLFGSLGVKERTLLGILALFRRPVDFNLLQVVWPFDQTVLDRLIQAGWVDQMVHPMVRQRTRIFFDEQACEKLEDSLADWIHPETGILQENTETARRKGLPLMPFLSMAEHLLENLPVSQTKHHLICELLRATPLEHTEVFERYGSCVKENQNFSRIWFEAADKYQAYLVSSHQLEEARNLFGCLAGRMPAAYQNLMRINLIEEELDQLEEGSQKRIKTRRQLISLMQKTIPMLRNDAIQQANLKHGLANYMIRSDQPSLSNLRKARRLLKEIPKPTVLAASYYISLAWLEPESMDRNIRSALNLQNRLDRLDRIQYVLVPAANIYCEAEMYNEALALLHQALSLAEEKKEISVYAYQLEELRAYIHETLSLMNRSQMYS